MIYFSVIIPTYQDWVRLEKLLEALAKQSFDEDNFEVLVINNDPENKVQLKDAFPFSLRVLTEKRSGSYAARNKGIHEAKGKVLAFIDSDCLPNFNWLETAFKIFEKDKEMEIGVLTGPVPLFFKDPNQLSPAELYEKYTGGFTTEAYAKEGKAITANWFSYKFVIEEFGGFNAELKSNGDSELSGRISQKYKIEYCPDLIVHHPARYHTSDLVNKYKRLLGGTYARRFQADLKAFRKHLIKFIWARYRFAIKRLFTLSPKESLPIFQVCHAINKGAIQEYFNLIKGGETKR
ncbi:glycosyltransferase family 2 protein [Algoriphagus sp. CAU 1675]|uniref:glycosyltransferase n=1 Tax=Algoriphagus sp. CAU 1675 TaxID=3032597 RepID=UPI0023D9FE6B|nr:glycosyltransferase family 2 protein [Algoriphagus sp. CAU 1675]MDF2159401.1 glycosyltransferase family 2 protein [Algoriphagus sp. CAU 1675]